jgi:hypothetical protein
MTRQWPLWREEDVLRLQETLRFTRPQQYHSHETCPHLCPVNFRCATRHIKEVLCELPDEAIGVSAMLDGNGTPEVELTYCPRCGDGFYRSVKQNTSRRRRVERPLCSDCRGQKRGDDTAARQFAQSARDEE